MVLAHGRLSQVGWTLFTLGPDWASVSRYPLITVTTTLFEHSRKVDELLRDSRLNAPRPEVMHS